MIIQVRVNSNDNLIYKLCEWNSAAFASSPVLRLQTSDLTGVKNAFSELEKILSLISFIISSLLLFEKI